jgi:hypothetical protein
MITTRNYYKNTILMLYCYTTSYVVFNFIYYVLNILNIFYYVLNIFIKYPSIK